MIRLNKKKMLIKKLIYIYLITILIILLFPSSASVSAATLDDKEIINTINHIEVNTSFNGLGQCYGFAKETFANIFNLNINDVNWDYEKGTTTSNYLYLVKKAESENELTELLSMAKAGDAFCWGGGYGNPHSMIFISKDDENQQIIVLDNNWGDNNIIKNHTIPYAQLYEFIKGKNIMSLFRYTPAAISLSSGSATLYLGAESKFKSIQLACTAIPDAYPQPVWSSSNDSVATVDQSGKITATGAGEAVVTCQIGNKSAQCAVTVRLYQIADFSIKYKPLYLTDFSFFQLNGNINKIPTLSTGVTLNPVI